MSIKIKTYKLYLLFKMKTKVKSLKKKGLKMSQEVALSPENHIMRVVVAFDAKDRKLPYLYVLNGKRCHETEHQIRKTYTLTTDCPYYDTRVILYETYVKRRKELGQTLYFGNKSNVEVVSDYKPIIHSVIKY